MPCDYRYNLQAQEEEERRRAEEERKQREEQLAQIEQQLSSGIAKIVRHPITKQITIVGGTKPEGMHDSCVLAGLQRRNSFAFQQALARSQVSGVDFISIHNKSHGWG